ncbi:hypothetical protein PINS_up006913 [Pythium insidiosum]|nr:hypothetical protein PINS_up006913 [Pythium insidiosum]
MPQPASNADAIGWRVRVFWEGDDEWFEGEIAEFCPSRGFYVRYDDGEEQWEAADTSAIEFLSAPNVGLSPPPAQSQWSAEPPPSTGEQHSPTPYDNDDEAFEDEQDSDEEEAEQTVSKKSPTPERYDDEDEEDRSHDATDEEATSNHPVLTKSSRDAVATKAAGVRSARAVNVKSAVFFRDDETLREMKTALQREKKVLQEQLTSLKQRVEEKEHQSSALRRELRDLKAQFTLGSLSISSITKSPVLPKTASEWMQRITEFKLQNRQLKQALATRQSERQRKSTTLRQLEQRREELQTRLSRVPRRELCSLTEIQSEIAHLLSEKRELDAQVAKKTKAPSNQNPFPKHDAAAGPVSTSEKASLEKQLRALDDRVGAAHDDLEHWRLSYERECARMAPVETRLRELQTQLTTYRRSQVLLRSLFLRADTERRGRISLDAAVDALITVQTANDLRSREDLMQTLMKTSCQAASELDLAGFVNVFHLIFGANEA